MCGLVTIRNMETNLNTSLAARVSRIKPSATLAVSAKAAQLRAQGKDIIGLGAGEPDFDTPEHIKQAAIDAIHAGQTKYTAVDGTAELKAAICAKLQRDNNLTFEPQQILVSCGAKHSIYNVMQALLDSEDEVLVPSPYWVSYPDMARLADAAPVMLTTSQDNDFKLSPDQLRRAINDKTRLLILNSPSNPTGKAYSPDELKALGEVLAEHPKVWVLSDEIYEFIYWGDAPLSNIVNVCPELRDRTIVINGVSKAYAMTGWRIGYAAAPADLIAAMKKIQSQSTSNACSISQAASVAALNGDQACVEQMRLAFRERHDYIIDALNSLPGVKCLRGEGAFYAFPSFEEVIAAKPDVRDDIELAAEMLEIASVALVPGSAFGAPGFMRISFATSMEMLESAIERMRNYLAG